MIDLFPHVRATLKASTFFASTLSGFLDSSSRFKVFIDGEAPTAETPFITVNIEPGEMNGLNDWSQPFVTFSVHGPDTARPKLWRISREIPAVFRALSAFAAVQQTFTANATTDVLTAAQHGLRDGDIVTVSSSTTLPGGLAAATDYYVRDGGIDTLKLSTTEGGSAIDITSAGSGTHKIIQNAVPFELLGPAIFDQGQDPVTENVVVSVALRFGIDS